MSTSAQQSRRQSFSAEESRKQSEFKRLEEQVMQDDKVRSLSDVRNRIVSSGRRAYSKVNDSAAETTCLCLVEQSLIRRGSTFVVAHRYFTALMVIVVVSSVFLLVFGIPSDFRQFVAIASLNSFFNWVFIAEFAMKWIAGGCIRYLRSPANFLELLVALASIADEFSSIALTSGVWSALSPTKERFAERDERWTNRVFPAFRTLRVFRMLEFYRLLPPRYKSRSLSTCLDALELSIPPLLVSSVVSFIILVVFSLLGMQLFSGRLWSCSDPRVTLREVCEGTGSTTWRSNKLSFDWIGSALLSSFSLLTGRAWGDAPARSLSWRWWR